MRPVIPPVIVIPGMTASVLHDEYELPPETVWASVLPRRFERITLHPEKQVYEFREPARVAPGGPFPLVYEDLIEELRDGLSDEQSAPVPVFPFGYDWRLRLELTEDRLAEFVSEVIERTLLLRHYRKDPDFVDRPRVNLVGHSMGGLIIAGYIRRHADASVNKVVTLASPFRGSYEAILKVATGTGDFGDDSGKARERRMARMTPALYYLLPSFRDSLSVEKGMTSDIFSPRAWQPSVKRSIAAQVKGWNVTGARLFRLMLDAAREHRAGISGLRLRDGGAPGTGGLRKEDWLAIVGVDAETRVGLRVRRDADGRPRFDLRSDERRNDWGSADPRERRRTGDGTVPLRGAIPPFLDENRLVCVTPHDFGYWELRDRALSELAGFHGHLPTMNMVHRLITRFLSDGPDPYGSTWGRSMPGVGREGADPWNPPLDLAERDA